MQPLDGKTCSFSDSDDDSDDKSDDDSNSDDDFNDEPVRSPTKRKKRKKQTHSNDNNGNDNDMERAHIVNREKLVGDREDKVDTRARRFAIWLIALSILVCIAAITLVTIYVIDPFGGKPTDTPDPTRLPTVLPIAVPTVEPTTSATVIPTPMLPNKVVVETTFLAFVPNGKVDGLSAQSLEEHFIYVLEVLTPQVLNDVLEGAEERIVLQDPISIDLVEVGKFSL